MEGKFTHYLITRYNVRLEGWDHDPSGAPTRDEDWMKHRESLFRRFCFPSVISQTNTRFQWLLYFESDTPETWLAPIMDMIRAYPFIRIRRTKGYHGCMEDIDEILRQSQTPYTITSRLDNDDGLGKRYIEYVQSHFIPEHNTLINLTEGIGYQLHHRVITRMKNIRLNHFSSYIESHRPEGGHLSVRGFQHGAPPEGCQIINATTPPAWLKIFHDRNLKSKAFGYPVWSTKCLGDFAIRREEVPHDSFSTLVYSGAWLANGLYRKCIRPLWK